MQKTHNLFGASTGLTRTAEGCGGRLEIDLKKKACKQFQEKVTANRAFVAVAAADSVVQCSGSSAADLVLVEQLVLGCQVKKKVVEPPGDAVGPIPQNV